MRTRLTVLLAAVGVVTALLWQDLPRHRRDIPPTPEPSVPVEVLAHDLAAAIGSRVSPFLPDPLALRGEAKKDPAWLDRVKAELAAPDLARRIALFRPLAARFFAPTTPAATRRSVYLALQDLRQAECELTASEGRSPPVTWTLLPPAYGPSDRAAKAAGAVVLVFCGHRPRHAIEPAWIRANSGPRDPAGSEWYADLLAAHLKAPRTRLIDGKTSDDPGAWSLSRTRLLLLEPQLLTPGGPVSRLEVLAAVTGLGDADRLELWLSSAGADPWPVAILRPPAGPHGGGSVEVCHGLEGGLLPRDPVRIGVKLTRSPASRGEPAKLGYLGFRFVE